MRKRWLVAVLAAALSAGGGPEVDDPSVDEAPTPADITSAK